MSTRKASRTKASRTDTDEQCHHSEWEMSTIADLVVWHNMPFLSVRELTRLNCPRWSMWNSSNITRIARARTLDDTRDWYFPIIVKKEKFVTVRVLPPLWRLTNPAEQRQPIDILDLPLKDVWSSWSGIWHATPQHASATGSRLPPMTHLPHEWLHFTNPRDDIIASAGGLLLITGNSGIVPVRPSKPLNPVPADPNLRRSKRLNPVLADSNRSSISDRTKLAIAPSSVASSSSSGRRNNLSPQSSQSESWQSESWQRLLVCNPLTRKCRELPAANCRLMGLESWQAVYQNGVQARLVVNEESNCYQVILTLNSFVAVYTSTTNSWNCLRFPRERPWGRRIPSTHPPSFVTWEYICGSAHVGGRLYFANVLPSPFADEASLEPIKKPTEAGTLQLFEVDPEAGTWQVVERYTLRKFHIPSLKYSVESCVYDLSVMPYVEILECMGGLYAVLPAKIHDAWLVGEPDLHHSWMSDTLQSVDEFGRKRAFMPLCFYIMRLQGHGVDCGVLRIQVPLIPGVDFRARRRILMEIANQDRWFFPNFFSCEARGSVIWVACEDCLLWFDVESRQSKTRIIPVEDATFRIQHYGEETLRFAYRPSLHMKP